MNIQFFEDFERTEYSDFIHGVIGRSLIIATRFDCSCNGLAMAVESKKELTEDTEGLINGIAVDNLIKDINSKFRKFRAVNSSIKSLKLPNDMSTILHNARNSRNEIAHDLCKGLDGCADLRIDGSQFIKEVSKLIEDVTYGDIVISQLTHIFNKDSIYINDEYVKYVKKYQENILNWVIEQ